MVVVVGLVIVVVEVGVVVGVVVAIVSCRGSICRSSNCGSEVVVVVVVVIVSRSCGSCM